MCFCEMCTIKHKRREIPKTNEKTQKNAFSKSIFCCFLLYVSQKTDFWKGMKKRLKNWQKTAFLHTVLQKTHQNKLFFKKQGGSKVRVRAREQKQKWKAKQSLWDLIFREACGCNDFLCCVIEKQVYAPRNISKVFPLCVQIVLLKNNYI